MTDARSAWQPATIEAIMRQTPTVKSVLLRPRDWRLFLPGQHVDVRLTAGDGYQARRSYSITTGPALTSSLEIAVELLPDGEVSSWFHEVARVGDTIEVSGPFAEHFVWRAEPEQSVLLIGGGSGVAPFMSMVRHRAFVAHAPPMTLLYSARSWSDVIYRRELLIEAQAQRGLRIAFALTRDAGSAPDSASNDHGRAADYDRRIDERIIAAELAHFDGTPAATFICGSNRFVSRVAELLVSAGVAPSSIRTERYGGEQ
jgi:ferredoxin-NADP reductase